MAELSPAAAKSAAKAKIPDPVFNETAGVLLRTRYWPTELWKDPWSLPRYRRAAAMLAVLIAGGSLLAVFIGELTAGSAALSSLLGLPARFLRLPEAASSGIVPFLYSLTLSVCGRLGAPGWAVSVWALLKVLVVVGVIALAPIFEVWWERKISAHMQSRFGPMYVGGFHGWLQTIADGIKLLLKENVTPLTADRWVHRLAPAVVVAPCILAFAPVSFGRDLAAADIDVGTLYVFAVAGVSVVGIMMAGWGSGNKYSLLGGLRSAAQLVSYELPRTFSIVPVIMLAGSLSLSRIADAQAGYWGEKLLGLPVLPRWFIFYPVVGQLSFLIFLIASVAETNRTPFDIPEAESELVAGFHTEYSGMKFSLFFLAEYAYMFLACLLATAFFLGGGAAPLKFLAFLPSWAWFLAKALSLVFCFLWFRWTFPRFRVDRLMDFNWKFLLPWSFANIAFAGLYLLF